MPPSLQAPNEKVRENYVTAPQRIRTEFVDSYFSPELIKSFVTKTVTRPNKIRVLIDSHRPWLRVNQQKHLLLANILNRNLARANLLNFLLSVFAFQSSLLMYKKSYLFDKKINLPI